jgi:hypothetical protein
LGWQFREAAGELNGCAQIVALSRHLAWPHRF